MTMSPNLKVMERALEKAGRSLIRDFNEVEKLQISVKGPGDFVSKADKRAEEIIVESLQRDRPDWGIMAEEGSNVASKDEYRFIIDPLDGTNNFVHGMPHWCMTIALEKAGEIVAGMTFDPVRQEVFRAEKGAGAFMNNSRLRIAGRKDMKEALINVDAGYSRHDEKVFKKFAEIIPILEKNAAAVRMMGASALDMCYVAAGRFDGMIMCGGIKPWDVAAGMLMIREATGVITDWELKPMTIQTDKYLAGSVALHGKLATLLDLKNTR